MKSVFYKKTFADWVTCLPLLWRLVTWRQVSASLNLRKNKKSETRRLIPRKL